VTPLDLTFQALADPTRRIMVERQARGPASVSELAQPLDMTLSAWSSILRCSKPAAWCGRKTSGGSGPAA